MQFFVADKPRKLERLQGRVTPMVFAFGPQFCLFLYQPCRARFAFRNILCFESLSEENHQNKIWSCHLQGAPMCLSL
jgi:hypothetical protein